MGLRGWPAADRATLIRSHVLPDLGNILHSRHQYHWHTGYVPPQTVACPHLGAWMAKVLGPQNPVIPPFINIGQRLEGVGEQEELKASVTAHLPGSASTFVVPDGFLSPGTEYKMAVGTVTQDGNASYIEGMFTTAKKE